MAADPQSAGAGPAIVPSLRLLLALRGECREKIGARLAHEVERAREILGEGARARGLLRVEKDVFAAQYPGRRAFDAVLCLDAPAGSGSGELVDVARGADERLGDCVQLDLSAALVGQRRRIKGGEAGACFFYCMRHKAGQSTAAYQEHWGGPHAELGRRIPGVTGYDQLHVAPDAARAAARVAGFGVWRFDGVAELHTHSLDEFARAAAGSEVGAEAVEDEKRFVDGPNSVGFGCEVVIAD